jgi:TRAP-type C4-dicarboxylate transport system permease small subunit
MTILNRIRQARLALTWVIERMVMTVMGILVVDVTWQVITRYILNHPSSWTEELATILMLWVSFLGAAIGFARRSHLGVDYFTGLLPERRRKIIEIAGYVIIAFFAAAVLCYGGYRLVYLTLKTNQVTPALGLKRGYVYMALPISGLFITLFMVEMMIERIAGYSGKNVQAVSDPEKK